MAYNSETKQDDNTNCVEHRWEKRPGGQMRSIGTITYAVCNNCLSLKVTWDSDVKKDGEWVKVTDEQIIQPNWK